MNLRRPVGLICLAGVSFLICVLLVLCGVGFLFELFRSLRHVPGAPEYYSLGYVLMFLAGFCSFVAAWIAAVAGLNLWRFRPATAANHAATKEQKPARNIKT